MIRFGIPYYRERKVLVLSLFLFFMAVVLAALFYKFFIYRVPIIADSSPAKSLEIGKYQGYSGTFINGRVVSLSGNKISITSTNGNFETFEITPGSLMAVSFAGGPILALPALDLAKISKDNIVWLKLASTPGFVDQIVVFKD